MLKPCGLRRGLFLVFIGIAIGFQAHAQERKFALWKFENQGCRVKGRVQDCDGEIMRQILAKGKAAVPILISQLTETARTREPIEDYWSFTTSGDVAFIILTDLFTQSDGTTFNMPRVPDWTAVMNACDSTAEGCWRLYVQKHGRRSVQQSWQRAWNSVKERIYWDSNAKCFRLPPQYSGRCALRAYRLPGCWASAELGLRTELDNDKCTSRNCPNGQGQDRPKKMYFTAERWNYFAVDSREELCQNSGEVKPSHDGEEMIFDN
jgi:hypothetical protein